MSQILGRFGTRAILESLRAKVKPCKCFTHKALSSEAEGTRTLNLRIDSPMLYGTVWDGTEVAWGLPVCLRLAHFAALRELCILMSALKIGVSVIVCGL